MLHRQSQTRPGRRRLPAPRQTSSHAAYASSSPHPRLSSSYTRPELSAPTGGTHLHQAIMRCATLALGLRDLRGPSHSLHTPCKKEKKKGKERIEIICSPEDDEPPSRYISLVPVITKLHRSQKVLA